MSKDIPEFKLGKERFHIRLLLSETLQESFEQYAALGKIGLVEVHDGLAQPFSLLVAIAEVCGMEAMTIVAEQASSIEVQIVPGGIHGFILERVEVQEECSTKAGPSL